MRFARGLGPVIISAAALCLGIPCLAQDDRGDTTEAPSGMVSRIGTPVLHDGTVYFGTQRGTVYAMDAVRGTQMWSFQTEGPVLNRPLIHEGTLFVGGQDGQLRAIDATTGEQRWSFQAGQVDWPVRDIFINGTPTLLDGVLYFSSEDFNVYALEAESGMELWRVTLGEEPQALEIPIVDGIAYIGAWDGYLYAIDVAIGEVKWRSNTDNDHIGRTVRSADGDLIWISDAPNGETLPNQAPYVTVVPIVRDQSVYFTNWAGDLMAVDTETGLQRWRFHPETIDRRHVGSRSYLTHFRGVLYYATLDDRHLYGVDARTGSEVWRLQTKGVPYGPMPADGGIALLGELLLDDDGRPTIQLLKALDLRTREVLWATDAASAMPWISEGVVYYGGNDQDLHGLDLRTGLEVWSLRGPRERLGLEPRGSRER